MPRMIHRFGRGVLRAVPPLRNWSRLVSVMRSKVRPTDEEFLVRLDEHNRMIINPSDYVGFRIYMCGYYEWDTVSQVKSRLKTGMTFFDIGAHFGQFTLVGAAAVGEEGRVHSFEPSPLQFSYLERNVELNGHKNVALNKLALGEEQGTVGFVVDQKGNLGGSHLSTGGEAATIEVELTTLDHYCEANGIEQIDLMKIDVEGAELMVFRGARRLFETSPPSAILYEAIDSLSRRFGYEVREVHDLLSSHGYNICVAENGRLVPAGPDEWDKHTDFVAVR